MAGFQELKTPVIVVSLSNLTTEIGSGGIIRLVNIFDRTKDQFDLTILCTNLGKEAYSEILPVRYYLLKKDVPVAGIGSFVGAISLYIELTFRAIFDKITLPAINSARMVVYAGSAYLPDTIIAARLKRKSRNAKYIQVLHNIVPNPLRRKGNFFVNILAYLDQRVSLLLARKYSDKFIVVNHELKEYLEKFGIKDDRIEVNFNGVDVSRLKDIPLESTQFDCAFVGRLDPNKGIRDLIEIMKIIKSRRPATKFIIVGGGIEANVAWLNQQINLNGLSMNVTVTGRIDNSEVLRVLKRSKVLVFPSREESFGIVIVEALACSCVPVIWNLPAFEGLFPEGVYRIRTFDENCFAEQVILLCENEAYRKEILEKGRDLLKIYNWDTIARKEYDIISSISDKPPKNSWD